MSQAKMNSERRIAAIVLPDLMCELATQELAVQWHSKDRSFKAPPLGVVMRQEPTSSEAAAEKVCGTVQGTSLLSAVNFAATRYGVREGQSIAQACALVSKLVVRELPQEHLSRALSRLAEMVMPFGTTVSIHFPDTIWLDVTGTAHLFGRETALASELQNQAREFGHAARVAISDGPWLARAFAKWGTPRQPKGDGWVISSSQTVRHLRELPVLALPLADSSREWLVQLGVLTVGDLVDLPRSGIAVRLGGQAPLILELCEGRDTTPLVAYQPPRHFSESMEWEEPLDGLEPLTFVLKGLCARISARLSARGEAAGQLELTIQSDRSIARLRRTEDRKRLHFELTPPIWREEELRRTVASRLEAQKLQAPSLGIQLSVKRLTSAEPKQLALARVVSGQTRGPKEENLPVLLAELNTELGAGRVGVFQLLDGHRPESRCGLFSAEPRAVQQRMRRAARKTKRPHRTPRPLLELSPARLFPRPLRVQASLRVGATLSLEHRLYTIDRLRFEQRLDAVEWWSEDATSRDYVRVWLRGAEGLLEALVFVDRQTGHRYVQAIVD